MGFGDVTKTSTGFGTLGGFGTKPAAKTDLGSIEGLSSYATQLGFGKQVAQITAPKTGLSFLQRLGKGLGFLNTADATETLLQSKNPFNAAGTYIAGAAKDVASAFTGTDYNPNRKNYGDVLKDLGVENSIARFGIGFVGDVLLDPSTYFGGAIAKGVGIGAKTLRRGSLSVVDKVAPAAGTGLRVAGDKLADALGKAFVAGFKSTKGASQDVLTFLSKRDAARFGLAASNLDRLGTGVLTKNQQEELALKLIAGKRTEFAAREINAGAESAALDAGKLGSAEAKSTDPAVQAAIEAQKTRSLKFGEQLGLENPYETYFPFIKKDKLENFLKQVQSSGIKVGSEGYRKQFKNLLTNENLELNPAKAFFTVEAQQVSDRMTRDFLQGFTQKYGKSLDAFKTSDEALKAGYKLVKEKGIFGKEVGYAKEFDAKLLSDLITPEFQTVNMLAKATGFDALTNLFKRAVTGLFLPFHVRNYASGLIQNFEALGIGALSPKVIAAGQKMAYHLAQGSEPASEVLEFAGKSYKSGDVFKAFKDRFGSDTFYQNDFLHAVDHGKELEAATPILSKQAALDTVKTVGLGSAAIPFRTGRAVGQFIEHQQKATAYITALGQGKTVDEALALAEKAGFDYRNLTAFESQIMRRLVPFYSFARKNAELQLATLNENPQRVNQILHFFGEMGDKPSPEEKQSLPDYLRNSIGIKIQDTPEGLKQYISSFGTPVEAFAQLVNTNPILYALSQSNPLLKTPVEIGIGKDSFRQRDLKDVYDAREYKNAPQIIKDLLDIKEGQKDILDKDASGKLQKTGERTVYVADPVRLLIARSLFTSRGVTYLDQVFGNDLQGFVKFLKVTTGIKPQQVDLEMVQSLQDRDTKRALEDLLTKTGNAAQFTRTYVPK